MIAASLAAATRLVTGASVRWLCDPRTETPRIYFANHSSHLDFVLVWSSLPPAVRGRARPVAGSDYWQRTAIRRYFAERVFHAVLIQRSSNAIDVTAAQASVARMADELDRGHSLIVFPEGTRRVDGEVGPFKSGLFYLSQLRPDAELIPVCLQNLNRILPKGEILPVPMLGRVVFGRSLPRFRGEPKSAFLSRARHALVELRVPS
jgi:1-acyl-sn-glycerol-3-phosphate acyltransferase